jgi:hypothetical protein
MLGIVGDDPAWFFIKLTHRVRGKPQEVTSVSNWNESGVGSRNGGRESLFDLLRSQGIIYSGSFVVSSI